MDRMPIFKDLGIKREVHGAISHPPDGNPMIGPAPGVQNYWCCCGTQIGIGWGPGLSRELARWIVHVLLTFPCASLIRAALVPMPPMLIGRLQI